jgi:FlaA1/EpsC-like NDP-sugar epimerase
LIDRAWKNRRKLALGNCKSGKQKVETRKQNFMSGIKDKVVVITGASSGIGEAT